MGVEFVPIRSKSVHVVNAGAVRHAPMVVLSTDAKTVMELEYVPMEWLYHTVYHAEEARYALIIVRRTNVWTVKGV